MNNRSKHLALLSMAAFVGTSQSPSSFGTLAPFTYGPIGRQRGQYDVLELRARGLSWAGDGVKPCPTRQMRRAAGWGESGSKKSFWAVE